MLEITFLQRKCGSLVEILNVFGCTLFVLDLRKTDRKYVFVRYSFNTTIPLKYLSPAPLLPQANGKPTVKKWNKFIKAGYIAAHATLSPNTSLRVPYYGVSLP